MKFARLFSRQRRAVRTPSAHRKQTDWAPRLERLEQRDTPSIAYSVSATGDTLVRFDTAAPSVSSTIGVSGLVAGEVIDGIAFRTQTGQMFAVAVNNSTHVAQLGTINLTTGVFTAVGSPMNLGSGATVSLTGDAVNDRLILTTDTGVSLTINPNNGSATANANISGGVDLAGIAFNNNFQGATTATLFGIDATNNTLVTIDTATGVTTTVGAGLGVGDVTAVGGFAIQSDGTALADLTVGGVSALYSINLSTGVATNIGDISGSAAVTAGLALAPISVEVFGTGAGIQNTVTVMDAETATAKVTIHPFGSFTGGVHVATGDVNGDGVADIVVAADAGGAPRVTVFDGRTMAVLYDFYAYNIGFSGGVFVAVGDVNGDGKADIITGAGAGGGPHVKVFSGADGNLLASFFAYSAGFTGGVRVAAGDLDLVGGGGVRFTDEIITGAGPGGGPHVRVFTGTGAQFNGALSSFFAYNASFSGGVFVAAGDVNGDGFTDILTGADAGGGPHVKVFSGLNGALLDSFFAFGSNFTGGVRVGVADVNGDGRLDILAGSGAGVRGTLVAFDGMTGAQIDTSFMFDPSFLGGIFVGGV
jgi:hypothetical protein